MKLARTALIVASTATLVLSATPSYARYVRHPRRAEVNGRLYNQNRRITAGVRQGELTHADAHQLRRDDRGIYREERQMAKLDGGHITKADQRALNQQENAVSRGIHRERHD